MNSFYKAGFIRAIGVILFIIVLLPVARSQDSLLIQGVKYRTDTLIHTHDVGLGTLHTYYRLPDLPLLVNVLDIDARNPHLRLETCLARDSIIGTERPSAMAQRNSRPGHQAFAAINGDFYNTVSPNTGTPVNGQMLAGQVAKVPHDSRPLIAFNAANDAFIDVMTFAGRVFRGEQEYALASVNSTRNTDNLVLFNRWIGTHTRTNVWGTEVLLSLLDSAWGVNRKVRLEVREVLKGKGSTPIPADKVVLSGHGKAASFLDQCLPGDTVEMEITLGLKNSPAHFPAFTEMIGGDRVILRNGAVLETNWPELHPRTAAGFSSDRSRVILVVVDGRSDYSKGVSTKQLADILKASGASDALNLDGGGSSAMVVRNKVKNSVSDGSERAVGNALLVVSTAIPGKECSMQLNANHITLPFGKKFQVLASTFDEAGEVVNYLGAKNIRYAVSGDVGEIDTTGLFTASGAGGSGWITGSLNGMTDSMSVLVKPTGKIEFSTPSLVIDNRADYSFKVLGTDPDGNRYLIDNDIIRYTSLDEATGRVTVDGRFRGVANGTVTVVVSAGEGLTDSCRVEVEIGEGYLLVDDFADPSLWSSSASYVDKVTLTRQIHPELHSEMLKVDYAFTYSNRTASMTLNRRMILYGMPDSILLEAAGSGTRNSFYYILDHPSGLCVVPPFTGTGMMRHKAPVQKASILQEDYPLSLTGIRLILEKDPAFVNGSKYSGSFWLKGLYAVYPFTLSGSNTLQSGKAGDLLLWPNPAREGIFLQYTGPPAVIDRFVLYDGNGRRIRIEEINLRGDGRQVYLSLSGLPPALYYYEATGGQVRRTGRILLLP